MTINLAFHVRIKHIDIHFFHFIHELVEKDEIILTFCNTSEQVADIFTKAFPYQKHVYCKLMLGACIFESRGSVEGRLIDM